MAEVRATQANRIEKALRRTDGAHVEEGKPLSDEIANETCVEVTVADADQRVKKPPVVQLPAPPPSPIPNRRMRSTKPVVADQPVCKVDIMTDKNALSDYRRSAELEAVPENKGGKNPNDYAMNVIANAALANPHASSKEAAAVTLNGMRSLRPADAIESALSAQILTANDTALELYRRAWMPDQTFEVRAKYLALADKSARTVAVLSDALDRRRGRGQQQIVVKHISVSADQAIVADQVVTGRKGGGDER